MNFLQFCKYNSFWFPPGFLFRVFLLKDLVLIFLHEAIHVGIRQINQRLILHKIIDVYPHIIFMNKWLSIFSKIFMCDVTHQISFGLGWTAVNGFIRGVVYILDNIIIFLYRCIYDIMCFVLSFWFLPSFWWNNFVVIFYMMHYMPGSGK